MSPTPHLIRLATGRALLVIQFLHALAQGMTIVVLPWLVLERGASVAQAGLVVTATFLPFVLLGLPAGALAGRVPRRPLLVAVLSTQAAVTLVMAALAAAGAPVAALLAAAFLVGAGRVFVDGAMFAAIGALVPRQGMLSAQAAVSSAFNVGYYGGPALGGLLIATAGTGAALGTMGAALIAGVAVAATLPGRASARRVAADGPPPGVRAGLRLVFGHPVLRLLTGLALVWSILSGAAAAMAVPHLRADLGLGGSALGAVMGAGVAAMLLCPLVLHRLAPRARDTRILAVAMGAYLVPASVFAVAGGPLTAALSYAPLMLANAVCAATIIGARARRTPAELQAIAGVTGRVVVITGLTAGSAVASLVGAALSPGAVFQLVAVGMAGLGACAWRVLDRPEEPAERPRLEPRPALAGRRA
ncbi:MAG TPA: MFS transporter [Miltoncostaeaceae bacterium]|nr:MFS transporter [Miltoncostaeaceae bacterium]